MANQWILLVIMAVHLVQCNEETVEENDIIPHTYEPSWMYKCIPDEGCQRTDHPEPLLVLNSTSHLFNSLDVCRTVCGRFGGLWPRPVSAVLSSQTIKIHPNYLRFDLSSVPSEVRPLMVEMTRLVGPNLMAECGGNVTEISETPVIVYIVVSSTSTILDLNTNESYALDVQKRGHNVNVHISANTIYGARHGLESFTQLVAADRMDYSDKKECSLRLVSAVRIFDKPAYRYRGLLIDSSRHFIPMVDLKRTIDGMAANKMNVFHWHVTDSHSFPLESRRVPQFTRYGAYSKEEIYSTEEVRELIRYAQIRGVRVIIEIDSPSHAGNGWQWGKEFGFGDLAVCVNEKSWRSKCIQPPCGQLNPANPMMYRVLQDLYRDIAELIPYPPLLHMGGDEVFFSCWNSSAEIVNYMASKGYNTSLDGFMQLWAEFHAKTLEAWDEVLAATSSEKQPVMLWSSELTQTQWIKKHLNKDRYIIEVWEPLSSNLLYQLLRLGYRTVSVPKDIWYLDHGFWGTTTYSNWRRMYGHVLPLEAGMLGGEVAMWTEYVDSNVLDTRIWPRAAAVAERLWSDPRDAATAPRRMQRARARLLARGLRPDALSPAWCDQHDSRCL